MDKVSKFNNPDFYNQIFPYNDISYRRYNRLTEKQCRALREYGELLPEQLSLTLKVFHLIKSTRQTESIPLSINVMNIIWEDFYKWRVSQLPKPNKVLPEETLYKELIFRGFKPLSQFKVRPQRSYVMTSMPIMGKHLIHPYEMGSNYRMTTSKGKELPYLWDNFYKIGLPGHCRVIFPECTMVPTEVTNCCKEYGKKIE